MCVADVTYQEQEATALLVRGGARYLRQLPASTGSVTPVM